jgi:hypothetical protein
MPDFAVPTAFTGKGNLIPYMNQAGHAVDKFGNKGAAAFKKITGSGFSVMGMIKGMLPILSAGALLHYANEAITAFEQSQAAVANVEAGLKSTNNAIGLTSKQIQGMAAQWQKITIFEDDAILQNVSAQLLTFGNIGKNNFDRVQRAILDVTAKLKGINATGDDLKGTSIMMGKMMEDPVKGLSAAKRIGISFNATEEDMVKQMVAANNTIGAQTYMLKIIERQYGGTAEALAKTDKGMELIARHQMEDAMENLGEQLIPLKRTLIDLAVAVLPAFNSAISIGATIIKDYYPVILAIAGGFALYKTVLAGVWMAQKIMMIAGWVQYLFMMRSAIMGAITATKIWRVAQIGLNFVMSANPIILIAAAIAGLIMYIIWLNSHLDEARQLFMDISEFMDKPWVQALLSAIPGMNTAVALRNQIKQNQQMQAPNSAQTESRNQSSSYQGTLNVNAPQGSTLSEKKKGAPPININLMGPDPIGSFGSY